MKTETKKHGGHNKNKPSPRATGSGPVWEIRSALGLTRAQLATKIGCSVDAIRDAEKEGRLPRSVAVQSNLHLLAPVSSGSAKTGKPESGGVFL